MCSCRSPFGSDAVSQAQRRRGAAILLAERAALAAALLMSTVCGACVAKKVARTHVNTTTAALVTPYSQLASHHNARRALGLPTGRRWTALAWHRRPRRSYWKLCTWPPPPPVWQGLQGCLRQPCQLAS